MEGDERLVQLRRSESSGYGFNLFEAEKSGLPPVIYEVLKDSPADKSGVLETGDIIVEINGKKVKSFTTKEVLKCLRLSNDVVTLKIKKDQSVKERVHQYMANPHIIGLREESSVTGNTRNSRSPVHNNSVGRTESNGENSELNATNCNSSSLHVSQADEFRPQPRPVQPKFETFMMTGDLIINLNTESSSSLNLSKKVPQSFFLNRQNPNLGTKDDAKVSKTRAPVVHSPVTEKSIYSYSGNFVRTSKSEDYLQKLTSSTVNIDIEDSVATSLNTLLDTSSNSSSIDRIVWTYNAPVPSSGVKLPSPETEVNCNHSKTLGNNYNIPESLNSDCSGSSSVYIQKQSENQHNQTVPHDMNHINSEKEQSQSMFTSSAKSKNDSKNSQFKQSGVTNIMVDENKIYVKVLQDKNLPVSSTMALAKHKSKSSHLPANIKIQNSDASSDQKNNWDSGHSSDVHPSDDMHRCYSPTDDESDVESLHSFHYSPKAIDTPSASRLAKRLFNLEGFKKSDVSRHLSKNNDFSRVVAEEYLKFFEFNWETLDVALRKFLKQFCLIGETQERERVLVHFSKRYLDCNPGAFKSQDAVHTLTCALMLLNTDLHGENTGRRMTCAEFIENLADLNEGENFPKDILKSLYHSIKLTPLEWAVEDDEESPVAAEDTITNCPDTRQSSIGQNPFLEVPNPNCATEYKKGYVMRKCCIDPNGKKTPMGKRSWKMFYATLRDLVLYLHKDENGFRKNQLYDSLHNAIRIHHALATKANDYTKKQNVFRLQTADQAEYLFQTSDSKELQSWIDTINCVSASLSAPSLAGGVGSSQKSFERPLLPVSHTKLNFREQLLDIEGQISKLEKESEEHSSHPPERSAKSRVVQEFAKKESFLEFELKRYRTYAFLLRSKMAQFPELEPPLVETSIGEVDETSEKNDPSNNVNASNSILSSGNVKRSLSDRYSYRAAIYKTGLSEGSV